MIRSHYKISVIALFTLLLLGCEIEPEKIQGCTDPLSINYNELAEEDDGSCRYEASLTVWYGEAVAQALVNNGTETLYFYLDGYLIGTKAASIYFESVPICGNANTISYTSDLGTNTSKSSILKVKDSSGNLFWETTINLNAANECFKLELTL